MDPNWSAVPREIREKAVQQLSAFVPQNTADFEQRIYDRCGQNRENYQKMVGNFLQQQQQQRGNMGMMQQQQQVGMQQQQAGMQQQMPNSMPAQAYAQPHMMPQHMRPMPQPPSQQNQMPPQMGQQAPRMQQQGGPPQIRPHNQQDLIRYILSTMTPTEKNNFQQATADDKTRIIHQQAQKLKQIQAQKNMQQQKAGGPPGPSQIRMAQNQGFSGPPGPGGMLGPNYGQVGPGQGVSSPAMYPGMSQPRTPQVPVQSPGSAYQQGPSPAALATPQHRQNIDASPAQQPSSVGSMDQQSGTAPGSNQPCEDPAYIEKIKEFHKYLDPLRRRIDTCMRQATSPGENPMAMKELQKLQRLLEILENKSKVTVGIDTLNKCESFLKNLMQEEMSIGQTLVDAVQSVVATGDPKAIKAIAETYDDPWASVKHLEIEHTLEEVRKLTSNFPRRKRKVFDESKVELPLDLPYCTLREVVALDSRFHIHVDDKKLSPCKQPTSFTLKCSLAQPSMPLVPKVRIELPINYPTEFAEFDVEGFELDYDGTEFLRNIRDGFLLRHEGKKDWMDLSTILEAWQYEVDRAAREMEGMNEESTSPQMNADDMMQDLFTLSH